MSLPPLPEPLTLRHYGEDEWPAVFGVVARAFLSDPHDAQERAVEGRLLEWDRTWAVFDGGAAVASACAFSLEMTLPAGPAPVAGISQVGVAGTHRRRGILRHVMTAVLTELHDGGAEPVAALWASEPAIYGRFGFGVAARHLTGTVPARAALLPGTPTPAGRLEVLDLPAALTRLAPLHAAALPDRVGDHARDDRWWAHRTHDPAGRRGGASPLHAVVHSTDGTDDGYVLLSAEGDWSTGRAAGRVTVRELLATTPGAEAALWRHVLDTDLVASVATVNLAPGSLLPTALLDPRAASLRPADNLHVRLVDVPRALAQRGFAAEVDLVLEVDDPVLAANSGRWRVRADSCEPTSDPADLVLGVRELGAVHLGGVGWGPLARAGLVEERSPGALRAAGAAWALPADRSEPHAPMVF